MSQLTLTGAGRSAVSGNGLLTGLVAYWPFSEAGGANDLLDLHGGAKTLTQVNSPGAGAGLVYASARAFDKTSHQFAWRSTDASLRGGADFTFAAWFNLASRPGMSPNYYMLHDSIAGNTGWAFGLVDNGYPGSAMQIFAQAAYAGGYYTAHTVPAAAAIGTWELAFCWYDHAAATIWVQRNLVTPVSQVGGGQMVPQSEYLKAHGFAATVGNAGAPPTSSQWFDGILGPVAMWSRQLTTLERAAVYNAGAGLAYSEFTL